MKKEMEKPKYYTQPEWLGGKRVLAKNVPDNYYSICCDIGAPENATDFEVLEHDNNMCITYSQFKKHFNSFGTRKEARAALKTIRKAYGGKL